jgi:GT2 family glycosyltransferase
MDSGAELAVMMNITLARNTLREAALISGADWFFMLDSDGCVDPTTINRLIAHNLPVSTCAFAQRLFDVDANPIEPESMVEHSSGHYSYNEFVKFPTPIMNAGHSFGCCLIRRDVLERVGFNFMQRGQAVVKSEDYTFFKTLRLLGIPFCCDQSIKTIHFMSADKFPFGWTNDNCVLNYDDYSRGIK